MDMAEELPCPSDDLQRPSQRPSIEVLEVSDWPAEDSSNPTALNHSSVVAADVEDSSSPIAVNNSSVMAADVEEAACIREKVEAQSSQFEHLQAAHLELKQNVASIDGKFEAQTIQCQELQTQLEFLRGDLARTQEHQQLHHLQAAAQFTELRKQLEHHTAPQQASEGVVANTVVEGVEDSESVQRDSMQRDSWLNKATEGLELSISDLWSEVKSLSSDITATKQSLCGEINTVRVNTEAALTKLCAGGDLRHDAGLSVATSDEVEPIDALLAATRQDFIRLEESVQAIRSRTENLEANVGPLEIKFTKQLEIAVSSALVRLGEELTLKIAQMEQTLKQCTTQLTVQASQTEACTREMLDLQQTFDDAMQTSKSESLILTMANERLAHLEAAFKTTAMDVSSQSVSSAARSPAAVMSDPSDPADSETQRSRPLGFFQRNFNMY